MSSRIPPCSPQYSTCANPPPLSFFSSLPMPTSNNIWGVYTLVVEKAGEKSRLYIGCETAQRGGVQQWLKCYDYGVTLPKCLSSYLDKGYKITSRGLLCWCTQPPAFSVGRTRVRMVALEAYLTYIFGAGPAYEVDDSIWGDLWPWAKSTMSWDSLCSHTAFTEVPWDVHNTNEEEFLVYNEKRREEAKTRKAAFEAQRFATIPELKAFLAKRVQAGKDWRRRNRKRLNKLHAELRTRNRESNRFRCNICEISLPYAGALATHNKTKRHLDKAKRGGLSVKDTKRYYCGICDYSAGHKSHFNGHLTSAGHKRRVEQAEAAAVATGSP
ncbi:hypothetical protein B0H66DRAFT_63477 [Apodospora peruviana]|uniref:C2H2-type domain-containing protein n=1 Tax=Apodospora peruviana TaxID=516989 RepID=A0AAE0ITV1_9PEZI|nr:hypothetical protein B0H66DRAFT_63477 [Apodospora peruviana]